MKSQTFRRDRVLARVVRWTSFSYVALNLIVAWLLQGRPELLWRWLENLKYLAAVFVGLQLYAIVLFVKQRSIPAAILILFGGLSFAGFLIFARAWLFLLSLGASCASGIFVVWPQLDDLYHRLSNTYREISQSNKV